MVKTFRGWGGIEGVGGGLRFCDPSGLVWDVQQLPSIRIVMKLLFRLSEATRASLVASVDWER